MKYETVELYLIYCNDRKMYWAPNSFGYVRDKKDAGRFTEEQAERIVSAPFTNNTMIIDDGK